MNFRVKTTITAILLVATTTLFAKPKSEYQLITPHATAQTQKLYEQLAQIQGRGILFGHHFTNVMGTDFVDWKQTQNRCDLKESVGDYPAVFGFDFGQGFTKQLRAVKDAARRGGIVTFSDHMPNPSAKTKTYNHSKEHNGIEIASVLPNGKYHSVLLARLDSIASFANRAVINGHKIPIIFRPWHEHTGGWFWWGTKSGSSEEYCQLWQFTVEYLRDKKGVDNFIYAFSPSQFEKDYDYGIRNPGSDYFDIAGVDLYCKKGQNQSHIIVKALETVVDYADSHTKVAAFTEFGYRNGIQNSDNPKWFTEIFLNPVMASDKARRIAYALTWRNGSDTWIPAKGDLTYNDFVEFYDSPYTIFLSQYKKLKFKKK